MARRRADRYQNALDLAEDLQAWLDGRVVAAHGTGALMTARKWVGRNRALTALTVLGLVAVIVVQFIANRGVSSALDKEQHARKDALATLAESHVSAGLQADSPAMAALFFDRAAAIAPDPEAQLANRIRTKEWSRAATRIVRAFDANLYPGEIQLHPTGRFLRIKNGGDDVRLYDVAAEQRMDLVPGAVLSGVQWSPDGRVLAATTGAEAALVLYDLPALTIRAKLPTLTKFGGHIVFSDDGSLVAAGNEQGFVWNVSDGRLLCTLPAEEGRVRRPVCFSPDRTRLVVADRADRTSLCIYPVRRDGGSAEPVVPPFAYDPTAHGGATNAPPAFIPGTSHFLYTRNFIQRGGPCELVRRDAETGAEVAVFPGILRFGGISPDGATFSGRSQQGTGIFDTATGEIRTRFDYIHTIFESPYSPDGSRV
jgi:hypothetical protein